MSRSNLFLAVGLAALSLAPARAAPRASDQALGDYFAVWSDNGRITPARVASLYGRSVVYYGTPMTQAGVYRDKMALVRRWPYRTYSVVPGSVSKSCDAAMEHCAIGLVLAWDVAAGAGQRPARGRSTVSLSLEKQDGVLKIVRESGAKVRTGR